MTGSNRWGVELNGSGKDQNTWKVHLKVPFDPYVQEITAADQPYLVLRSTAFDELNTSMEVHQAAKRLFKRLNMAMAANGFADPVTPGAVNEFFADGPPKRTNHLEAQSVESRSRVSAPELTEIDKRGKVIQKPPSASMAQDWMRAAALSPGVAQAMDYLAGNPGWVEMNKAREALHDNRLAPGAISTAEKDRFRQTANAVERHREGRVRPPPKPMTLWEARAMLTTWLAAAIEEVLSANPRR